MKLTFLSLVVFLCSIQLPNFAMADDVSEIEKQEDAAKSIENHPDWTMALKNKYNLSDADIQKMRSNGFHGPQMAIVSGLAQRSGKSIDEVMKMRVEQNMGWGKIAHELGVPPGEIGHAVSELRKNFKEEKRASHQLKAEKRQEKRQNKQAERQEKRAQKRNERHKNHSKGHSGN